VAVVSSPVTDNLASQGIISSALLGVSFVPTTSLDDVNGELVFGAVDSSKFTGQISFVPTTKRSPSSHYWGIDQSITYVACLLYSIDYRSLLMCECLH
jgi:cathepsin E